MKSLKQILLNRSTNHPCWIVCGYGVITAKDLVYILSVQDFEPWRGKRVALGELPALELLLSLIFLDGLAESIVFLPSEYDDASQEMLLSQFSIDIKLDGNGLNLTELTKTKCPTKGQLSFDPIVLNTTKWFLPTSGTTGVPKLIQHTFSSLSCKMKPSSSEIVKKWGSLYSMKRFAGLQVFLQAWVSGDAFLVIKDNADFSTKLQFLAENGCNALSATPSMWRKISMYPKFDDLDLKQITLGGEIIDQFILDHLRKKFLNARITHIYASTEVGFGFSVKDGLAGFPIRYLTNNPSGIQFKVSDENKLFFNLKSSSSVDSKNNWIDSGDVVKIQNDRVYFLGRANGSINVGGNKVMPEEVESIIKEMEEILFVQVKSRRNSFLGSLVEAIVVLKDGIDLNASLKKKIITHCSDKLESFKVPAILRTSRNIKFTATGKVDRN